MFKLILKFQDTVIDQYAFDKTIVKIGRRDDNDVVVDNQAVSGHHARIEFEPPDRYYLVDLESLNGTFLNEKKITRERLSPGEIFIIGKHSLQFLELGPDAEEVEELEQDHEPQDIPQPAAPERKIESQPAQQQDTSGEITEQPPAADEAPKDRAPERPKRIELHGSVTIISGGIPQIIELNKRLTTIGKAEDADIKCSGLLVGKTAAVISKRPNGFFLSYSEGTRKPKVNGQDVTTQVQLQDGDDISIANTHMTFSLQEEVL